MKSPQIALSRSFSFSTVALRHCSSKALCVLHLSHQHPKRITSKPALKKQPQRVCFFIQASRCSTGFFTLALSFLSASSSEADSSSAEWVPDTSEPEALCSSEASARRAGSWASSGAHGGRSQGVGLEIINSGVKSRLQMILVSLS